MRHIAPFLGLSLLAAGLPAVSQTTKPRQKTNANVLLNKPPQKDDGTKPPASKGVIWKFAYEKGRVTKFNDKVTLAGNSAEGGGFSMELKNLSVETIKDVSKTGDGTTETRSESGEVTMNGQTLSAPPVTVAAPLTLVRGTNGLIVKRMLPPTGANVQAIGNMEAINKALAIALSMPTPPQAVQPGDEWKTEITNPFLPDQKVVVTSQYEVQGKFGTMIVYRIRIGSIISVREDDNENADAIQVNGYYEFEPVKRRVVKSDITIDNLDIEFNGKKIRVSMESVSAMIGIPDQITPRSVKKKK